MLRPLGLAFLTSLVLAGCAGMSPPPKPLMSPLSEAKTHGYAERDLTSRRIEITYLAPTRNVSLDRAERTAEIASTRTLAEDLVLWRAAQVALARKASAFQVIDRRSDANLELRDQIAGYPYPYIPYHFRRRYYRRGYGYFEPYPYDPFLRVDRIARVQVKATLTIALLKRKRGDAIDARATAARMSSKYPNAQTAPAK